MEQIIDEIKLRGKYPTILQAFGLLGLSIVGQIGSALLFSPLKLVAPESKLMDALYFLLIYLGSFLFVLWFARREQRRRNVEDSHFSFRGIPLDFYPVLLLSTLSLGIVMEPFVDIIPMPDWVWEYFKEILGQRDIFTFLAVVIAAPVLEELLFRGIILKGFLKQYPPWKSILWSAFLFGLIHLNPWQFIAAMGAGTFIGWIYWRTGSLLPCIFIHLVNNAISFAASFYTDLDDPSAMSNSTKTLVGESNYLFFLLAGALLFALLLYYLNKRLGSTPTPG